MNMRMKEEEEEMPVNSAKNLDHWYYDQGAVMKDEIRKSNPRITVSKKASK